MVPPEQAVNGIAVLEAIVDRCFRRRWQARQEQLTDFF